MALYRVHFRWNNSHSSRTINMDYPSESEAIDKLVRQCTVPKEARNEIVIEKIERA